MVQYLAVTHKIPLRRFITPMGYGRPRAVADNSTAAESVPEPAGRSENAAESGYNAAEKYTIDSEAIARVRTESCPKQ